jgi:hypothetical protein
MASRLLFHPWLALRQKVFLGRCEADDLRPIRYISVYYTESRVNGDLCSLHPNGTYVRLQGSDVCLDVIYVNLEVLNLVLEGLDIGLEGSDIGLESLNIGFDRLDIGLDSLNISLDFFQAVCDGVQKGINPQRHIFS